MVYAAAYCPLSFKSTLDTLGFDGTFFMFSGQCNTFLTLYDPASRLESADTRDKRCTLGESDISSKKSSYLALIIHLDLLWPSLQNAYGEHESLVYSSCTIAPQDISLGMLKRTPFNLNRQAEVGLTDGWENPMTMQRTFIDVSDTVVPPFFTGSNHWPH